MPPRSRVHPDDPRYEPLVRRGFFKRGAGRPDSIDLPTSTAEVVAAVQDAVHHGRRLAARSGGHCLEGFVSDPAIRAIIDLSLMTGVSFDEQRGAFALEAGTTLGEVYRRLFFGWGVTLPAGVSPALGVGGHLVGGAFGFLCRELGLAADYLEAVEVVVYTDGAAKAVTATRHSPEPLRDLWWAHTGAGGGNFGIVTRYWVRDLPPAPTTAHVLKVSWPHPTPTELARSAPRDLTREARF